MATDQITGIITDVAGAADAVANSIKKIGDGARGTDECYNRISETNKAVDNL